MNSSLPKALCAALTCAVLGGCSTLLPSSQNEIVSVWTSYDDAVRALSNFTPYVSTRQHLHEQGLDPHRNPAVTVLHFADVLQKFSAAAMIRTSDVDRGIRDCLQAGKLCNAYAIFVKKRTSKRQGDFWLDSLGFKRETVTEGWSIEALEVFVGDNLVYQLVGGQPLVYELEIKRNPLGPLQNWGDRLR